jgi:hypothetical protein
MKNKKTTWFVFLFFPLTILFLTYSFVTNARTPLSSNEVTPGADQYLPYVAKPLLPTPTSTPTPRPTTSPTSTPGPTATPISIPGGMILINHESVALYDQIPSNYRAAAAALNMLFINRSVGGNISQGLDCLTHATNQTAPSHCKRWEHVSQHPEFNVDPAEVNWPHGGSRANWDYFFWSGGDNNVTCPNHSTGEWYGKVGCFIEFAGNRISQYDVLSFQFSYLEVAQGSDIAALPGGFFWNNSSRYDIHDLAAFEAAHPNKTIIYWTSSLSRGIGSPEAESFNEQMRAYAIANEKVLFDVAAILSHDPDGNACYDNRDGVPYDNGNNSENYPNDGLNIPAICQHYTTETDGGHLGSVSAGKIRVAKAFWVLMAQIAGWQPNP